jgi:hypothetical protein
MGLPILGAVFLAFNASQILAGMAQAFPPWSNLVSRRGFGDRPDVLPTPEQLVDMRIKEGITPDQFHSWMRQWGFDGGMADRIEHTSRAYLSALDYVTLWRREALTEEALNKQLLQLGLNPADLPRIKQVTEYYPTPQDIITMSVRDVFDPQTVQAQGLLQDIPPGYLPAAAKAGLPEQSALWFWGAHWNLPSPTQVYEMYHRGLITIEQVRDYLRQADYAPAWRDLLAEISHGTLNRVDIRRMHKMGVLSEEQVFKAYMAEGLNETDAQSMTEFTVRYNQGTEGESPDTEILRGYKEGIFSMDETISRLTTLGYSTDRIQTMIMLVDAEEQRELIDTEADAIIDAYMQGAYTIDQVRAELLTIGVPQGKLEFIIAREMAQARKRQKHATKSDLDRWLKYSLITDDEYTKRMSMIGYNANDINLYQWENLVELINPDPKKMFYVPFFQAYFAGSLGLPNLKSELINAGYSDQAAGMLVDIAFAIKH